MNKKGMLYKRTFSAAASALMAISAIAPMSVFAAEESFTEETSNFDIVNEDVLVESKVYLATNFPITPVKDAFSNAIKATEENKNDLKEAILKALPDKKDYYLSVMTTADGMIANSRGSRQFQNGNVNFDGKMTLNIKLGQLLRLSGNSRDFITTARDGVNKLAQLKAFSSNNILDESLKDGKIQFKVQLPQENSVEFTGGNGAHYEKSLVSDVVITPDGSSKVTVTLDLNEHKKLKDLVTVITNGSDDIVQVELPYKVTYSKPEDGKTPELFAEVKVLSNNDMFNVTRAEKNVHFQVKQNENNPAKIDLQKNRNVDIKDEEEEKPQKPSGTLTGGYPSSKPGSSNSSSVVRAMHRLYNPKTGEHFYTQSTEERDNLVRGGWNNEGIGWHAPAGSSTPVYRVFNPNSGDHHYTTSLEEYQTLTRIGWNAEGIGWYSESDKGAPIYRLYNKKIKVGSHHYTQNPAERDKLVNEGWVYEGIAWYAMK